MKNKKLHTNEHASSQFAPHGSISIRREDSIIYYEIAGPFNLEVVKAFARTVAALLNHWTPDKAFVTVSNWSLSMMTSPDALAAYGQVLQKGRAHFPKEVMNIWYLPEEIEGYRIMLPKWQALYEAHGYPLEIVNTSEQAQQRAAWHLEYASRN
ncbi:hypothetical protein [Undibacterium sp.]|uniref:hypothetical protein n=1 Tax=Undibacterium sp. TaxID=1914977 RepID=UPI0025D90019|nr:hypothetical protein [Undibacterium sp.]MCX7221190.1 hypothetical protein [Burkholderiales bacterium]